VVFEQGGGSKRKKDKEDSLKRKKEDKEYRNDDKNQTKTKRKKEDDHEDDDDDFQVPPIPDRFINRETKEPFLLDVVKNVFDWGGGARKFKDQMHRLLSQVAGSHNLDVNEALHQLCVDSGKFKALPGEQLALILLDRLPNTKNPLDFLPDFAELVVDTERARVILDQIVVRDAETEVGFDTEGYGYNIRDPKEADRLRAKILRINPEADIIALTYPEPESYNEDGTVNYGEAFFAKRRAQRKSQKKMEKKAIADEAKGRRPVLIRNRGTRLIQVYSEKQQKVFIFCLPRDREEQFLERSGLEAFLGNGKVTKYVVGAEGDQHMLTNRHGIHCEGFVCLQALASTIFKDVIPEVVDKLAIGSNVLAVSCGLPPPRFQKLHDLEDERMFGWMFDKVAQYEYNQDMWDRLEYAAYDAYVALHIARYIWNLDPSAASLKHFNI
jgi:hypothetical protein